MENKLPVIVEVFSTDVGSKESAEAILELFGKEYPDYTMNFDLDDCDRIFRVEGKDVRYEEIIAKLEKTGHRCCRLI